MKRKLGVKGIKAKPSVEDLVDMDYFDSLSSENQEYLKQFTDEFYCKNHGKEGSLHREELGQEEYEARKKELNKEDYARRFDMMSKDLLQDELKDMPIGYTKEIKDRLKHETPEEILNMFIEECSDEIQYEPSNTKIIIRRYLLDSIRLYLEHTKMEYNEKRKLKDKMNKDKKCDKMKS